jgi:predicted membrane chloride channel (bestrophin family)
MVSGFSRSIMHLLHLVRIWERLKESEHRFPDNLLFLCKKLHLIFIYCVTMAMGNSIGMWSILFGSLLGYVFFTIQAIGQKLEPI